MKNIRILSRNSSLAKIQAHLVADEIKKKFPDMIVTHSYRDTKGDIDLTTPLSKMPEQGVFTSDLRDALLNDEADMVVHSWKDLPIEMPKGTDIVSTLPRSDSRDILFFKNDSIKKKSLKIYSSSPRRERNLSISLPDLLPWKTSKIEFHSIRGNIQTRFSKFLNDTLDGVVIAKAAIDRLARDQDFVELYKKNSHSFSWMILPNSINPCAPGQGALAIEVAENNDFANSIAASINDEITFDVVSRERKILSQHGGGCHQKIGVSIRKINLGEITNIIGLTEEGIELKEITFNRMPKLNVEQKVNKNAIFPEEKAESVFFKRKFIKTAIKKIEAMENKGIFISRQDALLDGIRINASNILWTGGVETWKKLATKGYWINGTSDSLGKNNEPPCTLFDDLDWLNFTHDRNQEKSSMEKFISYELTPKEEDIKIKDKQYFYWMSGSAFQYALELYPNIIEANHACGLGASYDIIDRQISGKVVPFLNYEDWKHQITADTDE